MQISQTKDLLRQIALVDNRKVTPEVIEAWHGIIGSVPFDIAQAATKLAQQDPTVRYLEPRNIMGWVKEAAFRLDRAKPLPEEPTSYAPQPTCREHNEKIISCAPCCKRIMQWEQDNGSAGLHKFAKSEIYA